MKILLFTKEDQVERLGFAVRDYREHILPMVGLTKEDRNKLSEIDYDIGIGFLYPYKIPKTVLDQKEWINFHPGLLPYYGGRNLAYHAIMNDELYFGGSVHYMNENFDHGDLIAKRGFVIQDDFTAGDLNEKAIDCLYLELGWLLYRLVNEMPIPRSSQPQIFYYPPMQLDEQIMLSDKYQELKLRALTTKQHSAKIHLKNRKYKVVTE